MKVQDRVYNLYSDFFLHLFCLHLVLCVGRYPNHDETHDSKFYQTCKDMPSKHISQKEKQKSIEY